MSEVALPGPLVSGRRAQIATRGARGQPVVVEARECMGGGDEGRLGALVSPPPPGGGSQAMVAATAGWRRAPKGVAGAMAGPPRAPASDLPPEDLMVGGHGHGSRPRSSRMGGTVLACRPGMAPRSTPVR
jgi:hypothetical protein